MAHIGAFMVTSHVTALYKLSFYCRPACNNNDNNNDNITCTCVHVHVHAAIVFLVVNCVFFFNACAAVLGEFG